MISPEQRQDVRHLLRWTVVQEGGELRLSVLLDGDPGFTANYVAQTTESLHDLITGPVAQDIAAFRLSLDARDSSYPSGCEQTRASPITPSDEAAQVLQKGRALYRSGFTWEALNLTERALELDPRFAQASLLRGRLLFNVGTPYTGDILAVPEMHRALALPQRLEPWERELLERAMQFLSDGPSQAIPTLTPELLEDLGEVVRVEAEYAISLFREERRRALELSYDLLARNLNSFDVLVNGAGLVLDLDYTAEATEQVVRPLLEAHADDPRSHMTHGLLMIVHPEAIDRAEASLERSRELQGGQWQPRFGWLAGKMQYYAGRYERSLEILTESLGTTTHRDRFTSSQLEEMSVATRHDPIVDPRIYAFLALSSRALGRLDDAGRYLASHRKVLPGNPWTDYEEGRLLMLLEKPEDAAQSFTRALELDPSYTFAWFRRGRARLEIGDVSGARADLNHFVESMGSDALKHPRVVEALELLKAGNSPEKQG